MCIALIVGCVFSVLLIIAIVVMIHAAVIQNQLDDMVSRGYKLHTFDSKVKMLYTVWIWNAKHYTTADTVLDRL